MSYSGQITLEAYSTLGMTGIPGTGPWYINDSSIAFVSGNYIIQQSLDTGERIFLWGDKQVQQQEFRTTKITGFCVNSTGTLLATAVTRHNADPAINIFTDKEQIVNQIVIPKASSVSFISFHRHLKILMYIAVYSHKFELTIVNYQDKNIIKTVKLPHNFKFAEFNPDPDDYSVILYDQHSLCYVAHLSDKCSQISSPNYSKYTGFTYSLNDKDFCIASSERDLLIFQKYELRHTMTVSDESPINFLSAFNHGLICATENFQTILIQHIPVPKDIPRSFRRGPSVSYGIKHPIVWASFSTSSHQMVCDVDNRQLILVNIRELESNTENAIVNPNIVSHKGPVAAISSCAYKPMLVSCGKEDNTVIIWDYSKQASIIYSEFQEPLTDVSFHPSGDLVAVASADKLYLCAVTVSSLVQRAQWPLFNCLSIQFSNGGHFLVAASHIITFINPYTQEIIATCRGHTGLIQSLSWSPDDKRLVSCGSDGKIIEWNAVTQELSWDLSVNKTDFVSSVINERGTIIACSKTNQIHHLFKKRYQPRVSEDTIGFSSVLFTSTNNIIIGDVLGGITLCQFPFVVPQSSRYKYENIPQLELTDNQEFRKTNSEPIPFQSSQTFSSHCGEITRLCSSLDSKILFTSSTDSSICVFNIVTLVFGQNLIRSNIPILRCDIPRQQFFLVQQSRYDELQHGIEKLKRDIQRQRVAYETETIEALQTHQRTVSDLTCQYKDKEDKINLQIDSLMTAMDDSTIKAALIYQNMEAAHLNEAKALTNLYEQKLALEVAKCDTLYKEVEDLKCSYEERIYILQQQYKSSLEDLSNKVSTLQTQLLDDLENTNNEIEASDNRMNDRMIDLEVEFEKEKMAVKLNYHNKKLEMEKLEGELNNKCVSLEIEIKNQEQKLARKKSELKEVKDERTRLDKDIKAHQHTQECKKSELHDREETLQRQEIRLEQLHKSNQELTKFKEVMNYRLSEMGQALQPSSDEITRLKSELDGMNDEIRTIKRDTTINHRTMRDKAHQIEVLKNKLIEAQTVLAKKRKVIEIFTADLQEYADLASLNGRTNCVKELHEKYVVAQDLEENIKDADDTIDENTRQRKHLQENVMLLQRSVRQQRTTALKHYEAKSEENSQLLIDLNTLQKENKNLAKKLDLVEQDVDMLRSNLRRVRLAQKEQNRKRIRTTGSTIGLTSRVTRDWVKKNQGYGVAVVDGRGKYLHNK